ncbi:MAG: response regulator transcription factor [Ruminiclostridium sp.]
MFRVFVVDDEPSVLEGLKIMIPWSELDFELCGESTNGQDALLKLEKLRPHLIITDIRMPFKSGLELICEAQKLDTDTEFVILSGYADFAYVQEAMRYQAYNYLLKPLDKDEIISVLRNIKNKLDTKFLADYGFSQADIKTYKMSHSLSANDTNNDATNEESGAWKSVRDNFDEELTTAIKLMNYQDAIKLIDELFVFLKSKNISLTNTCFMVNSYVYHILRIAYEWKIKLNTILPSDSGLGWDFAKLKSYITDILSQTINLMLEDRRRNSRRDLYEVKTYIEENYEKELSVSYLAEMVFLEAGYLGDAFSKQFGCSIKEYQHRLRIEKAIQLIETTDMKLSDISDVVGYNNYNNFFSHFGRITHIKPTQYGRK